MRVVRIALLGICCALAALPGTSCAPKGGEESGQIIARDSRGKGFNRKYTRVISLAPNMTEIFCRLSARYTNETPVGATETGTTSNNQESGGNAAQGGEDGGGSHDRGTGGGDKSIQPPTRARLIAVSEQCDWPESIRSLPRAGSMLMPDYERILRLAPDIVLASFEGNPPALEAVLARANIPLYVARVDSLAALYTTLTNLSLLFSLTEGQREGMAWERELGENLNALRGALRGQRIFFQIGDTTQAWSFGKTTLLHDLIRLAGAENLGARRAGSFPQFDSEALSRLDPDMVILLSGSDPKSDAAFWARYAPRARLLRVPPDRFERPGPRMVEAMRGIMP